MMPAVVLTSHVVGLGVIRALGAMNVPVVAAYYDESDMGYVSKYVKERFAIPHPEGEEEQFLSVLVARGKKAERSMLIPADDATLKVISRNRALLADHYLVACPEWGVTERIIDKKHTYEIAGSLGIPCPKTFVPASPDDLDEGAKAMGFPCLVKPRQSHLYYERFKRKMVKVENREQMQVACTEAVEAGVDVMLQEYIPGDDTRGVNYNSYFADGDPLIEFTAEKVRLSPPGFGVPSVVVSKEIGEVIEPGRKLLRALGFNGYSCTEFKKDPRDGVYKLMEVNGRHNRSALLAVKCGINFPWVEYRHLVEGVVSTSEAFIHGVFWIDEFRDAHRFFWQCAKGRFPLLRQVHPYLRRHVFAVFDKGDPAPFVKRCMDAVKPRYG
jgi:predicted ATP-grasp superfamily ATP-dependent carboligase